MKKKTNWLSEEALQIAEKRREEKNKGEKERYKHLNAEFQRIARRDKKAFLVINANKQRKTTEWKRLKISSRKLDTKGTFHTEMGLIKARNGMDLTEAGDIRKRWQGEIRKPFTVISEKKYRKMIDWERLEISSKKLEIPREHFMQRWAQ